MNLTSKLIIHLDENRITPPVPAVQSDTARYVEVSLYAGNKAWDAPSQAEVIIRYRRPDGAGGTYDTLADGSKAGSVSGNTVTIALDPVVLAVAGNTTLQVALQNGDAIISTFSFTVNVQADPSAGSVKPADVPMLRGAYVVTLEVDDNGAYSSNRTSKELYTAYQKGLELRCLLPVGGTTAILSLVSAISNDGRMTYIFGSTAAWLSTDDKLLTMSACIADGQSGLEISVRSDEVRDGVGIASITQVREGAEDGATNILSVALTDGRKAEFIVRNGHSGVYVGSEEPEDESVNVWINPDGETYDPPQGAASLQPLTFTGAVEAVYDGTQPIQVEIPTDDHINELINTALAGIPNASEVAY